jgi:uncharacterized sulfatase
MPWYTWLRRIGYAERNAIRQEMRRLLGEGALKPKSAQWLAPTRPAEELYHLPGDPYEVNSVVNDPRHAAALQRLRSECDRWMVETRDANLLAEPFLQDADDQQGTRRATVAGPDGEVRVRKLLAAAKAATNDPDPSALHALLDDDDPAVRWWAAMGLGNREVKQLDQSVLDDLKKRLTDSSGAVRVAAAWAMNQRGKTENLLPVLTSGLKDKNIWTRLWAIQTLDEMGDGAKPALSAIREARKDKSNGYVNRVAEQVLAKFTEDR